MGFKTPLQTGATCEHTPSKLCSLSPLECPLPQLYQPRKPLSSKPLKHSAPVLSLQISQDSPRPRTVLCFPSSVSLDVEERKDGSQVESPLLRPGSATRPGWASISSLTCEPHYLSPCRLSGRSKKVTESQRLVYTVYVPFFSSNLHFSLDNTYLS